MLDKVNIPIFGVLENMSVHICSNCGHSEAIFGSDGGKALAERLNVPLLGQLPLTLAVREAMDSGRAKASQENHPTVAKLYTDVAFNIALTIADKGKDYSQAFPKIVVEGFWLLVSIQRLRPLQKSLSSNNRNPNIGFRLFSPPITTDFTQMPP